MTSPHQTSFAKRRAGTIKLLLMFIVMAASSTTGNLSMARGQSPAATLNGTIVDESGAVVPEVKITVFNLTTALQRRAITDEDGHYTIPLLPPGRYTVTAQGAGFAVVEVRDLTLNVGDQIRLRVRLKIGEIGETVTIVGAASGISGSAAVSTVVDRAYVENLPLNGRSFQSLLELAPGVVLTRASFNEQGQISAGGQRPNANYFTVDGVSANIGVNAGAAPGQAAAGTLPALTVLGGTNNLVSVDALEEFRIQTSTYAPEFGRTPGAQVSILTRSGSSELRGSLFDYIRHEKLDANNYFANARGLPRPAIRQHDFGGVLGGKLIRDRLFFFASYEGLRLRQPQVAVTRVPSLSLRRNAAANLKPYLDAFPLPNGADFGDGLAEFAASYSDPSRVDAVSLRLDATVGDENTIFARYNYSPSQILQRGGVIAPGFNPQSNVNPIVSQSLNTVARAVLDTETFTAGASTFLSATIANDLRFNFSRTRGATSFTLDDFGGAVSASLPLVDSARTTRDAGFQFLIDAGAVPGFSIGRNADNRQRQINLVDGLSVTLGRHAFKFGVDYRRLSPVYAPPQSNRSIVIGSTDGASLPAQAAEGIAKTVAVFSGAPPRVPVFTNFSAYAQDAWSTTRHLTFTYGVRWELNPPPSEANGNAPFAIQNFVLPSNVVFAPRGTPLWKTTYHNFAPRVGAVYQLSRRAERETVLRGGFGVFFDLGNGQAAQAFGNVYPFTAVKRFFDVRLPLDPAQAAPPPLGAPPVGGTLVAFVPDLELPISFQWNATVEQSLGESQTFSAAYVAAANRKLLREDALLDFNQQFSVIRLTSNSAASDYHALQLGFTRRLSRGLQTLVSYAWSHLIDNASSDALSRLRNTAVGTVSPRTPPSVPVNARGASDFDVRHSLTASATYNLPSPSGVGVGETLLRDWAIDGIFRARTATPVNVVVRRDVFGDGLISEIQRPDLIPGVPVYIRDSAAAGGRRLNPAAFGVPTQIRQGTLGYNALRGFGLVQLDLALRRQIELGERLTLQLRAEAFNVLNRSNFGNPVSVLNDEMFGRSTQTYAQSLGTGGIGGGLSPIYQVGGARSIQLALKVLF